MNHDSFNESLPKLSVTNRFTYFDVHVWYDICL